MGKNSAIPWTDHTFNPWWGCTKISPGCANCYAETFANRFGKWFGQNNPRRFFGAKHWADPARWNRTARKLGRPLRVFCGSMCDVFEDPHYPEQNEARSWLWQLIDDTPDLDWLLLTKRPENVRTCWDTDGWKPGLETRNNIWLGVTTENQEQAETRIPILLDTPAAKRFVSIEPLLGPVDLEHLQWPQKHRVDVLRGGMWDPAGKYGEGGWGFINHSDLATIDWVIVGDESGHRRRPAELDWVRSIRDQCAGGEVPFFFKQWHNLDGKQETPELDGVRHVEVPT